MLKILVVVVFLGSTTVMGSDYASAYQRMYIKLTQKLPSKDSLLVFSGKSELEFLQAYEKQVDHLLQSKDFVQMVEGLHGGWYQLSQTQETAQTIGKIIENKQPYGTIFQKNFIFLTSDSYHQSSTSGLNARFKRPYDGPGIYEIHPREDRFQSVLEHLDFLQKYPDTASNQNRARARQVLRIFYCEDLAPSKPPSVLHKAIQDSIRGQHGIDPSCMSCHYRLDPLARIFDQWGIGLLGGLEYRNRRIEGALVMPRGNPENPEISTHTSLTDLAKELKNDPRVYQCIQKRIWNYAVNYKFQMPAAFEKTVGDRFFKKQEIRQLFKSVVMHPYFTGLKKPKNRLFSDAAFALKTCESCHDTTWPNFGSNAYPFDQDLDTNRDILINIWKSASHAPQGTPMPPASGDIPKLNDDTLSILKSWYLDGARDDNGTRYLSDEDILNLFGGSL